MSYISYAMGWVLARLSDLFGNHFALSVLAFTVLVNIILLPLTYKYKGFILGKVTAELLIHDSLESLKLLAHIDWLHAQVVLQVIRQLTNSSHKPTLLY